MVLPNHDPGTTFRLPFEAEDIPDDQKLDVETEKEDRRPYILLTPCRQQTGVVTLAYCSTKNTQADLGAPHVIVRRSSKLFTASGFDATTYIYPCRLVTSSRDQLHTYLGRVIDEFPELRDSQLPRALGYRTGSYGGRGPARQSWRGIVVELNEWGKEEAHTDHAIVVADPEYSTQKEYLNAIPLFPIEGLQHISPDLVFSDALPWVKQIGRGPALAGIRFVFGIHHDDHLRRTREQPVDEGSMREIDDALRDWFDGTAW